MSEFYGQPLNWRLNDMGVSRDGAATVEVIMPWIASKDELANGFKMPPRPTLPGFPAPASGRMRKLEDGGAEIVWTYEFTPPGEGNGKDDKANWSRDANFRQRNIKEHPDFNKLKDKYGWDDEKQEFPPEMPGSDGGNGFAATDEGKLSPMYGRKSFDDLAATLVHTYYTKTLSGVDNNMYAIKTTPCPFMSAISGRDWLGLPAKAEPCGDGWRITQPWLLSAAGGHAKEIIDPLRKGK